MNNKHSDNEPYEPLEQRKARAIREKRIVQLYTHIFQSGCAIVSANIAWHKDKCTDEEYHEIMINQIRSIIYNAIELTSGKRPNKL